MSHAIARRPVAQRLREWLIARCLAPINLDGSQVQDITIDGQSVMDVTMDGTQVFSAIPDSENLYALYDFREEDGSVPVDNQEGAAPTLTNGGYSGLDTINSIQAGDFSGSSDTVYESLSSNLSQPFTVYATFDFGGSDGSTIWGGDIDDGSKGNLYLYKSNDGSWKLFAGSAVISGTTTDSIQEISARVDGSNSVIREEGTQQGSGDAGSQAMNTMILGSRDTAREFWDDSLGIVALFDVAHSDTTMDEVDQWIMGKYNI
jgi:hypothetical protein